MPLKVLIAGASIAGPAAAYWFSRAGATVTVVERFPELRTGGQNVDIRSVGVTVMRRLAGLEDMIRSKIYKLDGFQFVSMTGRPIATMLTTGDVHQQALISEYEIFRGDLAKIFYDLSKDKVNYIFDEQITTLDSESGRVEFKSGSVGTYDLVVAADGATSRTRALGLDCGIRDHIKPLNAWAAYFTIPNKVTTTNLGQSYSAVPGLFLGVGPDPAQGGNKVALISICDAEAYRQQKDLKAHVMQRLKGQGWKCDEIIEGLEQCNDLYATELVQVKAPLTRGKFALVGDAGHACGPTGAGTSLAMAGPYILAGEVMEKGVQAGLKSYEEKMKPILADLTQIPPGVPGILAPQTHWGLFLRNMLFRGVAFGSSLGKYFLWVNSIFGNTFGAPGDKYKIPEYEWPQ